MEKKDLKGSFFVCFVKKRADLFVKAPQMYFWGGKTGKIRKFPCFSEFLWL